jgi:hypothetical protein
MKMQQLSREVEDCGGESPPESPGDKITRSGLARVTPINSSNIQLEDSVPHL